MGVIQKQALRTTLISFVGIGIGTISQISMPFILDDTEQLGVLQVLNSVSRIFATIFCLGFTQITSLLFAQFRNEKNGHHGFFVFTLIFSLLGILLGEITFFLLHDLFIGVGDEYQLVRSLSYLIYPIIFFRIFYSNLDIYFRMLFKSVTGAFLEQVLMKVFILLSLILFWLGWVDYQYMVIIYGVALAVPGIVILILAFRSEQKIFLPQKELLSRKTRRKILGYGLFGVVSSASGAIIMSIDSVMINKLMSTADVGIYSVLFFAGVLVSVPSRGIKRVVVPVLSEAWKSNNTEEIQTVYKKSVVNQTVVGVYLFAVGWLCIAPALTFLPKYQDGIYVFFFIGLGQLLDMMTGINSEIIATSKSYRLNTYFNIGLAILVFTFNYFFILEWGIVGAAFASSLAMLMINIIRWFFLKQKFKLQPFNLNILIVLIIGFGLLFLIKLIHLEWNALLLMIFYFTTFTLVYFSIVLKLNLAPDVSQWLLKMKKRFL